MKKVLYATFGITLLFFFALKGNSSENPSEVNEVPSESTVVEDTSTDESLDDSSLTTMNSDSEDISSDTNAP